MATQRKWTKERIEAYLALHPNATLKEIGKDMGVSKQRVYEILKSLNIKLLGRTEKVPAKKGTPHSQPHHTHQELVEPGKSKALARYSESHAK
jgi:predicted ArsR family transcriptional regulator